MLRRGVSCARVCAVAMYCRWLLISTTFPVLCCGLRSHRMGATEHDDFLTMCQPAEASGRTSCSITDARGRGLCTDDQEGRDRVLRRVLNENKATRATSWSRFYYILFTTYLPKSPSWLAGPRASSHGSFPSSHPFSTSCSTTGNPVR